MPQTNLAAVVPAIATLVVKVLARFLAHLTGRAVDLNRVTNRMRIVQTRSMVTENYET